MGLLDGAIAGFFGAVFGDIFLDARIFRETLTDDGKGGWIKGPPVSHDVKVQEDDLSEVARAAAGYTAEDSRFLILTEGFPADFEASTDWRLAFQGRFFKLNPPISLDPAKSHYVVRATRVAV